MKQWITCREWHGVYHQLRNDVLTGDKQPFQNDMRMNYQAFEVLLSLLKNVLSKPDTMLRQRTVLLHVMAFKKAGLTMNLAADWMKGNTLVQQNLFDYADRRFCFSDVSAGKNL